MAEESAAGNAKRRTKRVTIRDVAKRAGVSVGAASTALRNPKSNVVLSQATRERVLAAARDLRYRPHAAARAMAAKDLRTIGVLTTEFCMMGSFWSSVLRGIANTTTQCNYHLMLEAVPSIIDMQRASFITEQQIDGIMIPAETEQRTIEAIARFDIPHVWINTELRDEFNCVHPDELHGMRLAVDYLVELGHRRIAYCHHNVGDVHHVTVARERGYVEAMQANDLPLVATYDRYMPVHEHIDLYIGMKPRPTAIIMFSDAMALLACNRLVERGLRIPEDISVIGNEGCILQTFAYRSLTTIKAPAEQLGATAVQMLLRQIETGEKIPSISLPEALEINESTAPPPPDA